MNVSVIVCTFNRSTSLKSALSSAVTQVVPAEIQWEVIVVDNNSTDRTRAVAEEFCQAYPTRFRYAFEEQQGKSHALNRGIREAKGSIVAFMDDDVVAETDWLQNLIAPLRVSKWAGVGGRIVPPLDFAPPSWLAVQGPHDLSGVLALFDKGREGKELTEPPFGTNMAFRREVFDRVGDFRPDLGPRPGSEIRGEDTEFGRRVLGNGDRLWYEPSAVVHHAVPEGRLRRSYFLRFQFDQGRASIREKKRMPPIYFIPRTYFTLPKIVIGVLLTRVVVWAFSIDSRRRFQRKCMVWTNFGQIVELCTDIATGNSKRASHVSTMMGKGNRA